MNNKIRLLAILALFCAPAAQAGILQFTFSGSLTHDLLTGQETATESAYSGTIFIDSTAPDTAAEANRGRYQDAVTGGSMQWDGVEYEALQASSFVFVVDQFAGSLEADVFAILFDMQAADGSSFIFSVQLTDFTQSIFSSDAMPSSFDLTQFAGFDPMDITSSFGSVIGPNIMGAFDSAQLTAVPNAATIWLVAIGGAMFAYRRRRARAGS
jgi:hypothetical protein